MIIDTHVHYWQKSTPDRPHAPDGIAWGEELLAEHLLREATEAGVDRIVQITPSLMGYDNRYAIEAAKRLPERIIGVFARFDPLAPGVADRLSALMAEECVMGVRLTLHQPPYDAWLRENVLHDFLRAAERQNVPLELFAPFQPKEIQEVARTYGGLQIMVDHMTIRIMDGFTDRFFHWKDVLELGKLPNIWMKVSYFPESMVGREGYPFPTAQLRFKELYDEIGPQRMIWGSNFPPVKRACSYGRAVDFVLKECRFLSAADKDAIMGGNFLKYMEIATGKAWL